MAGETHRTGLELYTYRNSATHGTPTWAELKRINDESLDLDKNKAEFKSRESKNRRSKGTTRFWSGSFTYLEKKNAADTDFDALFASWLNGTPIEIAVMDGPIATAGSKGFRIGMEVMKMSQTRNLEDVTEWSVEYELTEFVEGGVLIEPDRYTVAGS